MTLVDVYCSACGHGIAIAPGATARHYLCPLRRYGTRASHYVTARRPLEPGRGSSPNEAA